MRHGHLTIPRWIAITQLAIGGACGTDDDGGGTTAADDGSTSAGTTGATATTSVTATTSATASTTESSSGTTGTTTDDTTTGTTGTTGSTSGGSTSTADSGGSETGGLPDCMANMTERECTAVAGCEWDGGVGPCFVDCTMIDDEATCMEPLYCAWIQGACVGPV